MTQYRKLLTGELQKDGDEYLHWIERIWVKVAPEHFGMPITSSMMIHRRPLFDFINAPAGKVQWIEPVMVKYKNKSAFEALIKDSRGDISGIDIYGNLRCTSASYLSHASIMPEEQVEPKFKTVPMDIDDLRKLPFGTIVVTSSNKKMNLNYHECMNQDGAMGVQINGVFLGFENAPKYLLPTDPIGSKPRPFTKEVSV